MYAAGRGTGVILFLASATLQGVFKHTTIIIILTTGDDCVYVHQVYNQSPAVIIILSEWEEIGAYRRSHTAKQEIESSVKGSKKKNKNHTQATPVDGRCSRVSPATALHVPEAAAPSYTLAVEVVAAVAARCTPRTRNDS